MSETAALDAGPGTAPEIRLAECWADFTKAIAIYPDTNERVRTRLEEMLAALSEALTAAKAKRAHDPERGISILFRADSVVVEGLEHAFERGSPLGWLRARINHAGLAGAEFLDDTTAEGVIAFSRRLLENFLRKDGVTDLDELWPSTYEGIVLIDRRFEGTFGGSASAGPYTGGHGVAGPAPDSGHFISGLLAHPKVARRIGRLQSVAVATAVEGEEAGKASDLLRTIIDDLPVDDLRSRDALIQSVCNVMDQLEGRAKHDTGAEPDAADQARFSALLHQVSRQHFAREGPGVERLKTVEEVEETPAGGRPRDAGITDDTEQLFVEMMALPRDSDLRIEADGEEVVAEQLSVLMHYLVHLEQPGALRGLYTLLGHKFDRPGNAEFAVLRRYLGDEDDAEVRLKRRRAVIEFLTQAGKPFLLRACGALTSEHARQVFPQGFGLYLQTLDMDTVAHAEELGEMCAALGADVFLDPTTRLVGEARSLDSRQLSALFNRPDPRRLPLIHLLLTHHPEPKLGEAAVFLRALDLPVEEAFLLLQLDDYQLLTREYLAGLIARHYKRSSREDMHGPVSEVLCRHILAMRERDPRDRARLESIQHLARFPSARGWHLLQELAKRTFGPFGGKEPLAVRRLARDVSRRYEAA